VAIQIQDFKSWSTTKDPFKKRIQYFWGYKNHTVSDVLAELPIAESTKPANLHDSQLAIPLFKEVKEETGLSLKRGSR
jgi:hypothetical protein